MEKILNEDIILDHLIPHLGHDDTISLLLTCKQIYSYTSNSSVWRHLYKQAYGDSDAKLDQRKNAKSFYIRRKTAKLHVYGNNEERGPKIATHNPFMYYYEHRPMTVKLSTPVKIYPSFPVYSSFGVTTLSKDTYAIPVSAVAASRRTFTPSKKHRIIKSKLDSQIWYDVKTGLSILDSSQKSILINSHEALSSDTIDDIRWPDFLGGILELKIRQKLNQNKVLKLINIVDTQCVVGVVENLGIIAGSSCEIDGDSRELGMDMIKITKRADEEIVDVISYNPRRAVMHGLLPEQTDLMFLTNKGRLLAASSQDIDSAFDYEVEDFTLQTTQHRTMNIVLGMLFDKEKDQDKFNIPERAIITRIKSLPQLGYFDELVGFSNQGHVVLEILVDGEYETCALDRLNHAGCVDVCATRTEFFALLDIGKVLVWRRNVHSGVNLGFLRTPFNSIIYQISASLNTFAMIIADNEKESTLDKHKNRAKAVGRKIARFADRSLRLCNS